MENNLDFTDTIREKARQEQKEVGNQFQDESRERLRKITKKKMTTVMIGALSAIEEELGFLWAHDAEQGQVLTPEQAHMRTVYDNLRSRILDLGNNQQRNFDEELNQYNVEWQRYQMKFTFDPNSGVDGLTREDG